MIEVLLSSALICLPGGECHPVLVGRATPTGEYTLRLLATPQPAYRGDVLAFHEDAQGVYAVHRPPSERRRALLGSGTSSRRGVTDGCVNVADALYEYLRECCDGERVVIR